MPDTELDPSPGDNTITLLKKLVALSGGTVAYGDTEITLLKKMVILGVLAINEAGVGGIGSPGGATPTPTLAEVLAAGNDGGGVTITGSPISGSTVAGTGLTLSNPASPLEATINPLPNAIGIGPGVSIGTKFYSSRDYGTVVAVDSFFGWCDSTLVTSSVPDVRLYRAGPDSLRLTRGSNNQTLSLGADSGTGGGVLVLHQSASAPTSSSQDGMLFVLSGEVNAMDDSGNISVISPHAKDAPPELYEVGPGVDEMLRRANVFLATVQWYATTRRQAIDVLDIAARTGTHEESVAAWTEFAQRQATNRIHCALRETFAEYEARTGKSLVPGDQDKAGWLAMTPAQRWQKVEADRVAKSQADIEAWQARRDAFPAVLAAWRARANAWDAAHIGVIPFEPFAEPEPTFTEAEPAIYVAAPVPSFLA